MPGQPPRAGNPPPGGGQPGGRQGGIGPAGAAAVGAAAGFVGGFLAGGGARNVEDIRRDRHEVHENGVDYIREPGRVIVREGGRDFIVHDENERFRDLGLNLQTRRQGDDTVVVYDRPGGEQILTYTDANGRLLRRIRRFPDGREVVLLDNATNGRVRDYADDVVVLPGPPLAYPRGYDIDAEGADETLLYDTLMAPPIAPAPRRYTLDQVRFSPDLRARMRSIDLNTLTFDTGSWLVTPDQTNKLRVLAQAMLKAVARDPNEVFLVEGFTDATGNPTDNLSLSDRRAQSVATLLTKGFGVPPENLTTQGYGQQYPKEQTIGPSRINRRVTIQRITPLLAETGGAPPR
jgi:outer membrane protein OmpA-like peptidoglycan-associated protein